MRQQGPALLHLDRRHTASSPALCLRLASPEARRWNALSGTNFAPTSTNSLWQSETTRQFSSKSPTWARPGETSGGMRTEQLIFDAKYVN